MTITYIVQWLHILAGITWFGGYIFMTFAMYPALFSRPATEAKGFFTALGKPISLLMALSGNLVFILGIIRGTVLGPVRSVEFAFTTPYGLTWVAALVLCVGLIAYGAIGSKGLEQKIWDGEQFRVGAAQRMRTEGLLSLIVFGIILACMVLMRFGL
jgi:uncharacterized membrane protein